MRQLLKSVIITLLLSGPVYGQCLFRQSTNSQIHEIGPFVDSTDGVTEKNSLTIAASDIRLEKAGTDPGSKNSGGATFKEKGNYYITLDSTDTNTVGSLKISINMAGAVYVFEQCRVLTAVVYDALYSSSAIGYVSAGSGTNQINLSSGNVTVGSNLDKTGYALTSPYDPAKTAAQAGDAMKVINGTGTGQIALSSGQVTVATNNDKTGYALTSAAYNAGADALLDRVNAIESGETFRQIMRLMASALGGKTTGSGTSTVTFRDINDTKDVIRCSVSSGNRTSCTLDLN